jgi:two-component system LytT family sensor kinase
MKKGQQILQDSFRVLGSRLAMNIYFWIFLFILKYDDLDDQHVYAKWTYLGMMIFFMGFFAFLAYFNNFFLLPRLLMRKKRVLYFLSALITTFVVAFVYTFLIKYLPLIFPGADPMSLSIIVSPVSDDLSFGGILADINTYFFSMVVWLVIFSLLGMYHLNRARLKSMEKLIASHRETELAFLKNQMHPHFLFNTLNNLYALSLKKSDETPESILKLSSVLRYIIYTANAPLVPFDKEEEIIRAYVDIEMLRLQETPKTQFSIISDRVYSVPPLIWLPVLENVFKHTRSVEELEVDFRFSINDHQLHLFCKNNMPASTIKEEREGIGLTNLRKRLALLYPGRHSIRTTVDEQYFMIDLHINLL